MNTTLNRVTDPQWHEIVSYKRALSLVGGWSDVEIDRMTTAELNWRATGAWNANDREQYVGYTSILAHRKKVRQTT